jgi:DNA polymerase-3 subunit alpha
MTRYIFEKHTSKHTALLATYSTYQHDAVTRELGKVFGLPPNEIDKIQKVKEEKDFKELDELGKLVVKYGGLIAGFPSHLSIHASGIIISEKPITTYTATSIPPKGYPTTQFSMQEAEDIGLYKFDILSQRGLGKIKDALSIIKENKGEEIDIHNVKKFYADETVKNLLRIGKCIGCFYIESPAMRMLLAKLQADDYLRLVAASSIIRPGVAKSGMMREYILRYREPERRDAARAELPQLYDIMKETYGVMVYQEDVLKVAHEFAGLSLEEADHLRRGMSWKFKQRNEFHLVKSNFFNNCYAQGHPTDIIEKTWTQIESFANFAFSKGHSASYAVESYQALYLKAYFPLEYMVATLNNGGGFYRFDLYIHEARLHGATIIPPCVNNSNALCSIQGNNIYLGLSLIGGFEQNSVKEVVNERTLNGAFKDLYDFIKRVNISLDQLRILIRSGAFNFTGINKKKLLWEAHMMVNPIKKDRKNELFDIEPKKYKLPKLNDSWIDNAFDEIELFGFSLCSPFKLLKEELKCKLIAKDLKNHIGKTVEIVGYLVTTKNTQTTRGERMHFGTFLDLEGMWIDTVHFPPSVRAFPFRGPGCYLLKGKVVEEFDHITIEIQEQERLVTLNREDHTENSRLIKHGKFH